MWRKRINSSYLSSSICRSSHWRFNFRTNDRHLWKEENFYVFNNMYHSSLLSHTFRPTRRQFIIFSFLYFRLFLHTLTDYHFGFAFDTSTNSKGNLANCHFILFCDGSGNECICGIIFQVYSLKLETLISICHHNFNLPSSTNLLRSRELAIPVRQWALLRIGRISEKNNKMELQKWKWDNRRQALYWTSG